MNWYFEALKKYAVFSGRSRRKEYWYFFLFSHLLIPLTLGLIEGVAGIAQGTGQGILILLYQVATLFPSIAVSVRRLHDIDKSGWWLLIGLIPIIGAIVLFIFFVQGSTPNENRFGKNPKQAIA